MIHLRLVFHDILGDDDDGGGYDDVAIITNVIIIQFNLNKTPWYILSSPIHVL